MKKWVNMLTILMFLGISFFSPISYAKNIIDIDIENEEGGEKFERNIEILENTESYIQVTEEPEVKFIRSDPTDLGNRETGEGRASVREVYLSGANSFDLSEISTGEVCGEGYHLMTKDDWNNIGGEVSMNTIEHLCYSDNVITYFDTLLDRHDYELYSLDYLYDLKFGYFSNYVQIDHECARKMILEECFDGDPSCEYFSHMAITTSENSRDSGIYYDPISGTFKTIGFSIETDPETGDSLVVKRENDKFILSKNEPLLCISEEVPTLTAEIIFVNKDNGFQYKTNVGWGEKLSQDTIDYIGQNNPGYIWFFDINKVDLENEEFKYNTILYGHKSIDKENITYKGPYNIENRKNNEIIATIKEVSINTDKELNILDIFSTENICGTGFHYFTVDRGFWEGIEPEGNPIGIKVSSIKKDLYLENINNYPHTLLEYFPNYVNSLGFFMLSLYGKSLWLDDMIWNYFKFAEQTSENSADIFNYFGSNRYNLLMETTLSIETDAETGDSRIVIGEEAYPSDGYISNPIDFLCVSDEVMQVESEVIFINEDNNFEYRTRMSSGGKVSQEDLNYINEENPNYLWYVADVMDIDIENEAFEYNTLVTARKPVIVNTENDEIVKLKSIQNSPYFAEDFDEYEDEVTWFYDRESVCGNSYHAITGDELTNFIISWNLSENDYNWRGDNTLTYCVSNPEVLVTFKNDNNNFEYEVYVEKGQSLKTRDIDKVTKSNTGYEWYNGDTLVYLTGMVFSKETTLLAKRIEKPNEEQSHHGGSGGGGSSSSSKDNDKNVDKDKSTPVKEYNKIEEIVNKSDDTTDKSTILSNNETIDNRNVSNDTKYSPEMNQAYNFAKSNGITTKPTIASANMNGNLTRIQMAKMLSYYAINILGKTPDYTKTMKFKDVSDKLDSQYDNGVTLSYQLGIMGINMPNNKFRPYDEVPRAEFVTALSRMMYGIKDGTGKTKYYEPHMAKLYNEGIINNTNPKMKERRGYAMLMLMRSAK